MSKRDKTSDTQKKTGRREEREVDRLVARTGLSGSAREMARQYGRGMLDGMRIAYLAVAERLVRAGNSREEIASFLGDMLDGRELESLLDEAERRQASE